MKPGGAAFEDVHDAALKVVIGYEDLDSGLRAVKLCHRAFEPLMGELDLRIWKFEPLGIPEVRSEAVSDASGADVLIVSVRGDRPLPLYAVEWIEECCRGMNFDGAIVFAAESEFQMHPAACLASAYLEALTRRTTLKYFAPPSCIPAEFSPRDLSGYRNSLVGEAVFHSSRHDSWGLNE